MIVILGLVILVAAVIAGVAGVLANGGHAHAVTHFAVFGYHVTGSTGTLFLYGIVIGALAMAGLSLLLAGARRTSRRGREARLGLAQSRRETAAVSEDRDDLTGQRDTARAYTASTPGGPAPGDGHASPPATAAIRACAGPACPSACSRAPARSPRGRPAASVAGQPAPGPRPAAPPEPRPARPPRSPPPGPPPARPRPRNDPRKAAP